MPKGNIAIMIKGKKVFILGAGASQPLGFPTGQQLTDEACSGLASGHEPLYKQIIACGIEPSVIDKFVKELRQSVSPSIDSFLEHRPEFMPIGKYVIAHEIIRREAKDMLSTKDRNWYPYLFNILAGGTKFGEFVKNSIGFITFNYDRSLEQFLFITLQSRYGKSETECIDIIKNIPIIHVYGQLNPLPWQKKGGRHYIAYLSTNVIKEAAKEIIIINEDNAEKSEFERAYPLLLSAEQIYILGFGYHPTNLDRLKILNAISKQLKPVKGSAYKIKPADSKKIRDYFKTTILELGHDDWDVLEFLQNRLDY